MESTEPGASADGAAGKAAAPVDAPYVGRPATRVEDAALLTGHGLYADDAGVKPGTLYAAIVRSPFAHADVLSIDAAAALALPGVRAVLTGADVKRWSAPFPVGVRQPMEHWSLAVDRARYVGEPVAVVVAKNRYVAEDALDLVDVKYRELPVAVDPERAADAAAPVLHPAVGSNVVSDRHFSYGDPAAAFAAAERRVSLKIHYPRNSTTPIECFVVVAEFLAGDQGYDVLSNFQGPFAVHTVVARALKVGGAKLRLRFARDSGGSFGVKQAVSTYIALLCLASRKAGAPVKWVEDRYEHLLASAAAPNRVTTIEAAVRLDGEVTALRYDQLDDCGGYLRAPEPATLYRMHGILTGAYKVRNLEVRNRVVLTNKTPSALVRGFGGPQMYFALERLMQRVAVELNLDPLEVIGRNLIGADAFPYRAPAGALLGSGNYQESVARARREGQLDELFARRAQAREQGRLYGIGYAAIVEPSISNMGYITTVMTAEDRAKAGPKSGAIASATVSVDALGSVSVIIDSVPAGQGHRTVAAQVVADVLGLSPDDIVVNTELDTQKDAWSIAAGNYSSRFAGATAGSVHLAALKVRGKMARIAADTLHAQPDDIVFSRGQVFVRGKPGQALRFHRVAGMTHWSPGTLPQGMTPGLRETVFWSPPEAQAPDEHDVINSSAAHGFIFDICAVEIDRVTEKVRIDRYVTSHDAGRLLNPALANGQIRGGFAQGLGAALMEEYAYGADGSFLAGTFADYLVPTAFEVPDPVIAHLETPSPYTPLGAKGLGEGNNMSTPVCIANAVADALGVALVDPPLTPSRIHALLGTPDPAPSRPVAPGAMNGPASSREAVESGGAVLKMAGSVTLSAPPRAVYDVLLDPVALAKVVPGCRALNRVGENRYAAEVVIGVGLVKARYRAEIELTDLDPPNALSLGGKGISSLGAAEGSGRVRLEPTDGGTLLSYDYGVSVSGKVAAVGGRMLEGAARIILRQLFERLGRQAVGGTAQLPTPWWRRLLGLLGLRR
ncbi:MAG: xanthine dehydrogenase family protein molybdopterin-binding subunit [Candidimonas sp.]|nr:MAG: xanthine dehydrogenase family protein molybdopterin-binding subunit [Candidimonas sp.]